MTVLDTQHHVAHSKLTTDTHTHAKKPKCSQCPVSVCFHNQAFECGAERQIWTHALISVNICMTTW